MKTERISIIWAGLSLGVLLLSFIWKEFDPANTVAIRLYFAAWMSTLLAVGYFSTPSGSIFGKISFGSVAIMIAGIAMKIYHLVGADLIIIVGLLGVAITYFVMWSKKKT